MKYFIICSFLVIFACLNASGSVTLRFNAGGLPDASGTPANGMLWGIVVNSTNSTMSGTAPLELQSALLGFTLPTPPGVGSQSPNPAQIGTSDYYFIVGNSLTAQGSPPTFEDGFIGTMLFDLTGTVGSTDAYSLIWFPTISTNFGSSFGYLDLEQTLPGDGQTITLPSLTLPSSASYSIVPEPSKILFLLFGIYGMVAYRRR